METQYRPVRNSARGWVSLAIRPASLAGFAVLATVLLVGIVILTALSRQRSGFVAVEETSFSALGYKWKSSLLWTALPTFIVRLAVLYWDGIVAAFVDRQPYVELSRSPVMGGVSLEKSILLDYRTVFAPWRWFPAFKNRHVLVGFSILLGIFFSTIVNPLSASLMAPKLHYWRSQTSILETTEYNEAGLNSTTNWKPVFDKVSTVLLYNGEKQAWTDDEFAFPAFAIDRDSTRASQESNVTTTTNGTSAYLDCKEIKDYQSSLVSTTGILRRVSFGGSDRGCNFNLEFGVANTTPIYLEGYSEPSCSTSAYRSRLVFVAGRYSDSSSFPMDSVSVISCVVGYATTMGRLTFSSLSNTTGLSFETTGDRYLRRHEYAINIESGLFQSTDFSLNAQWTTSHFGSIVLYLTTQKSPSTFLSADVLIDSIRKVFSSTYLTAAAMNSFPSNASPSRVSAILLEPQTRLFVVEWVAALSIATLALCLLLAMLIWRSVRNNHTILNEEPQGLLSAAGILHGSNIYETLVSNQCATSAHNGRYVEWIRNRYDVKQSLCILHGQTGHSHPVVGVLDPRPDAKVETEMQAHYQ